MTIRINYLDNGIGIEIIAAGLVTGEEIIRARNEIYNEENLKRQNGKVAGKSPNLHYSTLGRLNPALRILLTVNYP